MKLSSMDDFDIWMKISFTDVIVINYIRSHRLTYLAKLSQNLRVTNFKCSLLLEENVGAVENSIYDTVETSIRDP